MKTLLITLLLVTLTGCAGGDYDKYADTMSAHSTAEATRVAAQANAIRDIVAQAKPSTAMEGTLLAVIGTMQVERLAPVALNMTKPTTGMDVFDHITNHIPFMAMALSNWGIANAGFKAAGDHVTGDKAGTYVDKSTTVITEVPATE